MWDLMRDGVTQTLLKTYAKDRAEFKAHFIDGYRPIVEPHYLVFGDMVHTVLEHLNREGWGRKGYDDVPAERLTEEISNYLDRRVAELATRPAGPWIGQMTQEANTLACLAQPTLAGYFSYWKGDAQHEFWEEVEGSFEVRYRGLLLRGKRDAVFRKRRPWLRETKTKGRFTDQSVMSDLKWDFQSLFYMLAFWKQTGELPGGVEYDVIRRSGMKPRKGENNHQWACRVGEDIIKRPGYYYSRYEMPVKKNELELFERKVLQPLLLEMRRVERLEVDLYPSPLGTSWEYEKYVYEGKTDGLYKAAVPFPELQEN